MLAQSFKTAKELGISQQAIEALQKVLVLFETEKVRYIPEDEYQLRGYPDMPYAVDSSNPNSAKILFNMSSWSSPRDCGTVCCIGGTAALISGIDFNALVHSRNGISKEIQSLYRLFYPDCSGYDDVTVDQAAQALRNYLTTGEPQWPQVMPEKFRRASRFRC